MKKVAILHASTTKNYGTMMLVVNFIKYFNNISDEDVIFYVDHNVEGVKRFKESAGLSNIQSLTELGYQNIPHFSSNNMLIKLYQYFLFFVNYGKLFKKYNIENVVILGGDDFSEYYSIKGLIRKLLQLYKLKKNEINVFLYGQTIGPFNSWRKLIAKVILKDLYISTRDLKSYNYLKKEFNDNNISMTQDLAFLDLPLQKNRNNKWLKKFNLDKQKYIVLIPSGIWDQYCDNKNIYIQNWIKLISRIMEKYNYNIILLAHVLKENSSDKKIINKIYKKYLKDKRVKKIVDKIFPYEAREILGNSILSITGRMHGAISTFQKGRPSISLSYSVKYEGVIGDGLKRKDLIIESSNNNFWNDFIIPVKIINKMEYILGNYNEITKEIKKYVNKNQINVLNSLKKLNKEIGRE